MKLWSFSKFVRFGLAYPSGEVGVAWNWMDAQTEALELPEAKAYISSAVLGKAREEFTPPSTYSTMSWK